MLYEINYKYFFSKASNTIFALNSESQCERHARTSPIPIAHTVGYFIILNGITKILFYPIHFNQVE